jgi:hypothetical protein
MSIYFSYVVDLTTDASDAELKQECLEDEVENANLQIVRIDESETEFEVLFSLEALEAPKEVENENLPHLWPD